MSQRLQNAIAGVVGAPVDSITDESSPESIAEWDSLNHLNIVMALEGEFGVSLEIDDVLEMQNVGMIRKILAKYGVEA